jgi:hypothetical protein
MNFSLHQVLQNINVMDIFSKNKFLQRVVLILIFLNIVSISFFWFQQRENRNRREPRKDTEKAVSILTEKLQLDKNQEQALIKIRDDFYQKEEVLIKLIKSQRDSMNIEMFNENTDTIHLNTLAKQVAENEYQMELYRINQAKQLKDICNKEQLKKFKDLMLEIRDFFQPKKNTEKKNK